jgi:nitroreductase
MKHAPDELNCAETRLEFFEVLRLRRSVRAYESRPVEPEKLQRILTAANSAPSAGNLQAYEIVVVRRPKGSGLNGS